MCVRMYVCTYVCVCVCGVCVCVRVLDVMGQPSVELDPTQPIKEGCLEGS